MADPTDLPLYQSHKKVRALQIKSVAAPVNDNLRERLVHFADDGYGALPVPWEVFSRYEPQPGDYYVVYDDNYVSFSPKKAFEDGYTRL